MRPWWVKRPSESFTDETLAIDDTYGYDVREIVVLVMEVDKVADEATDMEVDKVTNMWNFVLVYIDDNEEERT